VASQRKHFLLVFYGGGKGKTCAAIGLAVRAAGHGHRVVFAQFIKRDIGVGEYAVLKTLPGVVHVALGPGLGSPREEVLEHCLRGLDLVLKLVQEVKPFLTVLDELGVAIVKYGLPLERVLKVLDELLLQCHVVVTGKYMPRELIDLADLATEFREVKHYFRIIGGPVQGLDY